uniref:Uncharacterized protein n=1 Tax=Romanomermis culicivorax TaxID=13658 RepID=A0A915IJJ3_ROMCU
MTHAQSPNKPITFRSTIQHITCPTTYWSNSDINKCRNNMIETKSCDIELKYLNFNNVLPEENFQKIIWLALPKFPIVALKCVNKSQSTSAFSKILWLASSKNYMARIA